MSMYPEEIAAELKELERDGGRLTPGDVVERARDPDNPLHEHFEWDDGKAAEKHRLSQARTLIKTVRLEITVRDVPLSIPRYLRDPDLDGRTAGYRAVASIRSEEDSARAAVIDEMRRVAQAVRRAKSIAAVLGVVADMDAIDALASRITERVSLTETPEAPAQ